VVCANNDSAELALIFKHHAKDAGRNFKRLFYVMNRDGLELNDSLLKMGLNAKIEDDSEFKKLQLESNLKTWTEEQKHFNTLFLSGKTDEAVEYLSGLDHPNPVQIFNALVTECVSSKSPPFRISTVLETMDRMDIKPNHETFLQILEHFNSLRMYIQVHHFYTKASIAGLSLRPKLLKHYLQALNETNKHHLVISTLADLNIRGKKISSDIIVNEQTIALVCAGQISNAFQCLSLIKSGIEPRVYDHICSHFGELGQKKLNSILSYIKYNKLDESEILIGLFRGYNDRNCVTSMHIIIEHLNTTHLPRSDLENSYIKALLKQDMNDSAIDRARMLYESYGELHPFEYIEICLDHCIQTGQLEFAELVLQRTRQMGLSVPKAYNDNLRLIRRKLDEASKIVIDEILNSPEPFEPNACYGPGVPDRTTPRVWQQDGYPWMNHHYRM
jgi:hypothetical protein